MSNRFDDIFAVDKLRQSWASKPDAPRAAGEIKSSVPPPSKEKNIYAAFLALQHLIVQKYDDAEKEVLNILMDDLNTLLKRRYPALSDSIKGSEGTLEEPVGNECFEDILNTISDLIEALDLGRQ